MKNAKIMMPFMVLLMAFGLAFANNNAQANGWINLDNQPVQLQNDPCTGTGDDCKVIFEDDDEETVYDVYTDATLQVRKPSGSTPPYVIPSE